MTIPDTIERELMLPIPRDRVWAALTDATQLAQWFSTRVEMDLR